MWTRLTGFLNHRASPPETALGEKCEVVSREGDTLTVRPLSRSLRSDELQKLLGQVRRTGLGTFGRVHFDFSHVAELVGPWGVHFAMLIQLVRDVPVQVCITGLHGQPAALAWLFRESPELRSLLS
jgi:hypothetical protein